MAAAPDPTPGSASAAAPLNGDLAVRVIERTAAMPWTPSPSGGVARKRLHRVGPQEAGQVTSLVRYDAGARFSEHPHPQGEEILVLDGVFSDHSGDYPAGTWLANPEGFSHAPFSDPGCVLFVKLRQFPGVRPHLTIDTTDLGAFSALADGISQRVLFADAAVADRVLVQRWRQGSGQLLQAPGGLEIFIIDGELDVDGERLQRHDWLRLPAAEAAQTVACSDVALWMKTDAEKILRTASENE